MTRPAQLRERIIDAALELGEHRDWEAVRLFDVAAMLDITLDDIRQHFREKEDVVEAFFDRADAAMLAAGSEPGFDRLPTRERLHTLIMAWLDALAPHHRMAREMIRNKLEPGHIHIQIPGLLRVSRTVQWVREAAGRDATYARRAFEETALTSIYLMTFMYWMRDTSRNAEDTRRFLAHKLQWAERLDHAVYRGRPAPTGSAPRDTTGG